MAKILSKIRSAAVRFVDPDRDRRIDELKNFMIHEVSRVRGPIVGSAFIDAALPDDLAQAKQAAYRHFLTKAWKDGQLGAGERQMLSNIGRWLHIAPKDVEKASEEFGMGVFETVLDRAMADGQIDEAEAAELGAAADGIGVPVSKLVSTFFRSRGEAFLRNAFARSVGDGTLDKEEWKTVVRSCERLGVSQNAFLSLIGLQAERFVESVLANAKADGVLTKQEESTLRWLGDSLGLSSEFVSYMGQEIDTLKLMEEVRSGKLPSLDGGSVERRSGELLHYEGRANFREIKIRQSGPIVLDHYGCVAVTSGRLVFDSETKAHSVPLAKVISFSSVGGGGMRISTGGKGSGEYFFAPQGELVTEIIRSAVRRANQTLTEAVDGAPSRHIPRDVRQKVWQIYGGKCVDCQSTHYLEFDHIVPVAKGGSNTEQNVQLLCRGCNLKKRDNI